MKIAVLCGGLSRERDVSISTGTGAARALRARGHQVALIDLFLGYAWDLSDSSTWFSDKNTENTYKVSEAEPDLEAIRARRQGKSLIGPGVLEICRAADITFLALHGGAGENGQVQALLDMYGIPYTGSGYVGSAVAMDKEITKVMLHDAGILTPPGILLRKEETPYRNIGFPCVVKPCSGGSSVGTSIVTEEKDYGAALASAFDCEDRVLVEKYIKGRELTVGVLGGRAMAAIEIIPKSGFYDYKNKYQAGLTEEICPAPVPDEITVRLQNLAESVFKVLHLDAYARVDFLWNEAENAIYVLEANTLPGMTPTSLIPQMAAAEGMDYGELCEKIIENSMKKYNKA